MEYVCVNFVDVEKILFLFVCSCVMFVALSTWSNMVDVHRDFVSSVRGWGFDVDWEIICCCICVGVF